MYNKDIICYVLGSKIFPEIHRCPKVGLWKISGSGVLGSVGGSPVDKFQASCAVRSGLWLVGRGGHQGVSWKAVFLPPALPFLSLLGCPRWSSPPVLEPTDCGLNHEPRQTSLPLICGCQVFYQNNKKWQDSLKGSENPENQVQLESQILDLNSSIQEMGGLMGKLNGAFRRQLKQTKYHASYNQATHKPSTEPPTYKTDLWENKAAQETTWDHRNHMNMAQGL